MFFDPSQTPLRLLAGGLFSLAPTSVSFGELEHRKGGMDELGSSRHLSFLREGKMTSPESVCVAGYNRTESTLRRYLAHRLPKLTLRIGEDLTYIIYNKE